MFHTWQPYDERRVRHNAVKLLACNRFKPRAFDGLRLGEAICCESSAGKKQRPGVNVRRDNRLCIRLGKALDATTGTEVEYGFHRRGRRNIEEGAGSPPYAQDMIGSRNVIAHRGIAVGKDNTVDSRNLDRAHIDTHLCVGGGAGKYAAAQ